LSLRPESRYRELRSRRVLSAVGEVEFLRPWYLCHPCHQGQCPADAALDIEKADLSPGVRRMLAPIGSEVPFDHGRRQIAMLAGLWVRYRSGRATAVPARRSIGSAHRGGPTGADSVRHSREVKLGCVFTQTGWDQEGYAIRDAASTTYSGAIETAEEFGKRIYLEAWNRGWSRAQKKIVMGDGAEWIWNLAEQHFPGAVQIVDITPANTCGS
jgi:hypothetical protein